MVLYIKSLQEKILSLGLAENTDNYFKEKNEYATERSYLLYQTKSLTKW